MITRRRPERFLRGSLLVELLIGFGAMVIAAVWLLTAYHSSLQLTEVAQQAAVALDDLKDMMEKIKSTPFAQLATDFPNGTANGGVPDKYGTVVGGYSLQTEQVTVTHQPNAAADPRELVVQVTWTNGGRTHQRRVSTMRSSRAS